METVNTIYRTAKVIIDGAKKENTIAHQLRHLNVFLTCRHHGSQGIGRFRIPHEGVELLIQLLRSLGLLGFSSWLGASRPGTDRTNGTLSKCTVETNAIKKLEGNTDGAAGALTEISSWLNLSNRGGF